MSQLLAGNTALVLGVANRWSLASAILTFQGDRQKQTVEELANDLHAEQAIPCDVSSENQLAALTSRLKGLDTPLHAVVHSIAFANRDDLSRPFLETSRDGFKLAHEISAYSLIAVACATAALMPAKDVGGGGERRVGVGYRAREPFVPAAVEDVYGGLFVGSGDCYVG